MIKTMIVFLVIFLTGIVYADVRTVVYMLKETVTGQYIFIKGGHDAALVPAYYISMSEPITYNNLLNPDSLAIKQADASLDWGSESALDWTCNIWPSAWGTKKVYSIDGYGEDIENKWGLHYWKFDVKMSGNAGDWFEFKAFMRQNTTEWWENNISQAGTPYVTINHWGKKGYITVVTYGQNAAAFYPLAVPTNLPPAAALTLDPTNTFTGNTVICDASASTDPEDGTNIQVRFDFNNDGIFDTAYSYTKTASTVYTTAGIKTIKVEARDSGGLLSTKTSTVTIYVPSVQTVRVHYQNALAWATPKMHWGYGYYLSVSDLSPAGTDSYGPYFEINWNSLETYLTTCFNNGSTTWDGVDRRVNKPLVFPADYWIRNGDTAVYTENPIDVTPPIVTLTSPVNGALLTGSATLSANASDNKGVSRVEFYYNSTLIGSDTVSPYSISWDTTLVPRSNYSLTAKAFDAAGNLAVSPAVSVTVSNTNRAPVANAGSDILVAVGGTAFFDASQSYDPDGTITNYVWDNGLTGIKPSKVYTAVGTNTIILTVWDNNGAKSTDSVKVIVTSNVVLPTGDFREDTIYFLLTTRFYDGDPANNYYNRDRIKIGDPQWRGDFKGLIARLDYIKGLGFTAIWITPPVENRSGLDYHGYHAYDFTKVDPRLESSGATYQDLINAAHAKGIKIIQDVVINHSCNYGLRGKVWINRLPIKYFRPIGIAVTNTTWTTLPYSTNLGDYMHPWREDNDNPVAPAWFKERQTSDPLGWVPLTDPVTGQVVGTGYNANRFFGTDYALVNQDPEFVKWYHTAGFISGGDWESPWPLQQKSMAGDCIDLYTESQTVRDYINSSIYKYLDMGVDAIRLDTVKHVERGDLLNYVNAWKAHKPGLFVFGENLVKGTGYGNVFGDDNAPSEIRPWWYTRLGTDQYNPNSGGDSGFAVLDFPLFSTFRDNVSKGSFGGVGMIFSRDWVFGDPTKLVTFLQNHDVGPDNDFMYRYKGDQWMGAATYNMLWTIRGIPCLYYGEEVEFQKGKPQDIVGTSDTLDMTGRAYFGDYLSDANIGNTMNQPLYKHIQRLNMIRKAVPALQKGIMYNVSEWGSGLSFVRDYNNGQSYAVVGLTMGGGQTVTVSGIRNGTYKDCVSGNTVSVANGTISFYVNGNSAGIWVLNGPGKIGTDGLYLR